jgi:hypothetical protein
VSAAGRIGCGTYAVSTDTRPDLGADQTEAEKWVLNSTTIPGLVAPPVWTSLEDQGIEVWGPSLAGFAKLGEAPQWVGNWVGLQTVQDERGAHRRMYLSEYLGPDGKPHKYKVRSSVGSMPSFLEDALCGKCEKGQPCEGEAPHFATLNLGVLFSLQEESREKTLGKIQAKYPDAPGLRAGAAAPVVPNLAPAGVPVIMNTHAPTAGPPRLPLARVTAVPRSIPIVPKP